MARKWNRNNVHFLERPGVSSYYLPAVVAASFFPQQMNIEQLRTQRAALEALATTLESMEEDARIAATEFRSSTQTTRTFIATLEKEATGGGAGSKIKEEPIVVMLASSSRWRRALIAEILPEGFEMAENPISPDIDEKAIRREDPEEMVKAIAAAKADKVLNVLQSSRKDADNNKVHLVICADQVVVYGTEVREKPLTKEQAKEHLQSYGLNQIPAKCVTAIVVACPETSERFEGIDTALQYFKKVPDRIADALVAKGDILYCAGSFVVEDPLLVPYLGERVGELESVQGMPRSLTQKLLMEASRSLRKHRNEVKRMKMA